MTTTSDDPTPARRARDDLGKLARPLRLLIYLGVALAIVELYRQASTLAYADAFRAIMVAFVVAALLVPLMRSVAPKPAPADVH